MEALELRKSELSRKEAGKVYVSNNYESFKTLKGNREVNKVNVKRISDSMSKRQLISPIIVNELGEIIDGQHRFEACKELNLPVYYIIANGYGLNEVQVLNTNSKNWNNMDYLNAYCDLGKEDYILFADFMDKYPMFHIKSSYSILTKRSTAGSDKRANINGKQVVYGSSFKDGTLKISDLKGSYELAEKIKRIGEYTDAYNKLGFVTTIVALNNREDFDMDYFIQKLAKSPFDLSLCATGSQFRSMIEDIYNYRNRKKISFKY